MSTVKRYLFEDRSFDPDYDPEDEESFEFEEEREEAEEEAAEEAAEAEVPPPPTFSEDEVHAAQQTAYDEGKAAGLQEAAAQFEHLISTALTQIAQTLPSVFDAHGKAQEEHESHALAIARHVSQKVIPAYSENYGLDEIVHVVTRCLEPLRSEPRIIVKVHETLREATQEKLSQIADEIGFDGRVVVMAHEDIVPGDCRVEWSEGGADRNSETLWQQIDEIIERNLTQTVDQDETQGQETPAQQPTPDTASADQDDAQTE